MCFLVHMHKLEVCLTGTETKFNHWRLSAKQHHTPSRKYKLISSRPSSSHKETFAEYTARTTFERPLLRGVAYAQTVMNSEREEFESQHGGTIRTMAKELSAHRDEYAPVIFAQRTVSYLNSCIQIKTSPKCICSRSH